MKKILITGGAGFIGAHLCKRLLDEDNSVICLDNFSTGSFKNVEHLLKNSNFTLLEHDVVEKFSFEVDEIYNLACPASPPRYQLDPIKTLKTSVLGAINVLELAKEQGAKVLQASTSEVYGDPTVHPQNEGYFGNVNPTGPRSCYDEGKRAAETLMSDYHRQYGVKSSIVRIFNTYGPKMDPQDGRVVSNFIVQAISNKDITIYGDGTQTRSFCYVDDLIDGLILMMQNNSLGPINLGNIYERSIQEFAQIIIELTNSKSKIIYKPLPLDDPKQRKPDISLAKELLGWEPKVDLTLGLQKTVQYFKETI